MATLPDELNNGQHLPRPASRPLPDQGRRPVRPEELARYPIARAGRLTGLHPQTLRDYDRAGLVRPTRTAGGRRLYTERDLERARRVRTLTADGVPVVATRRILRLEDGLRSALERVRILEDQNRRLSERLQKLELARR